jgi:hypothetical protein
MTVKPPTKRAPQATPRDPADAAVEQPSHQPADWLVRAQQATNLAERRRLRRLQQASEANVLPPTAVPRGERPRIYVSMRWFSGAIIVTLLIVLFLFTRDIFFISEIYVGGTHYLAPAEIFERSGIANMHIFWVDPTDVANRLKADPAIADAIVEVGWPPNMVQITITEREPALIWEQNGQRVWVDVGGHVMYLRTNIPDLPRVVVEKPSKDPHIGLCPLMGMNRILGPGSCIDAGIVAGALQFKALYPNATEMVYDPAKGLGFHDGNGWTLWFGDGTDIDTKMTVYQVIVKRETAAGKRLIEVNVSNPDAPYYSVAPTGH